MASACGRRTVKFGSIREARLFEDLGYGALGWSTTRRLAPHEPAGLQSLTRGSSLYVSSDLSCQAEVSALIPLSDRYQSSTPVTYAGRLSENYVLLRGFFQRLFREGGFPRPRAVCGGGIYMCRLLIAVRCRIARFGLFGLEPGVRIHPSRHWRRSMLARSKNLQTPIPTGI